MKEKWKPVLGFESFYEVSSLGNVRAIFVGGKHGHRKPFRILSPYRKPNGYVFVHLKPPPGRKGHSRYVHRIMLESFVGRCPEHKETRHLNGVRHDNRIENLAWGTRKQNDQDKDAHGTRPVGSSHHCSKLTEDAVRRIRESSHLTLKLLSSLYGVSKSTIGSVISRTTWKHL